jgi:hypothetical protein
MERKLWIVGCTLIALMGGSLLLLPAHASAGPGYINFLLGQKLFKADDWDPIDKQTLLGVEGVYGPTKWPVHIDTYLARSSKSKEALSYGGIPYHIEATTRELGVGVNKTWTRKKLYPYLGAGLLYAKVDVTVMQSGFSGSDGDNGFGGWGSAGAFYRIGSAFNLGGAARYSAANVDFNSFTGATGINFQGGSVQAGGFSFGVLLGWGWPATR